MGLLRNKHKKIINFNSNLDKVYEDINRTANRPYKHSVDKNVIAWVKEKLLNMTRGNFILANTE